MQQCKTVLLYSAQSGCSDPVAVKKRKAVLRSLKGEAYLRNCMVYDEPGGPETRRLDNLPDYAILFSAAGAMLEHFVTGRAASESCHFTSSAAET